MPELKDSGARESFSTGAVRDNQSNKPRPALISPFATERIAEIMAKGAVKYAARNWEKGMQFSRVLESLERHLIAYKKGKIDEDHMAQLCWNAMAILHYEEMIKRGLLPADLDDMPKYEQKAKNSRGDAEAQREDRGACKPKCLLGTDDKGNQVCYDICECADCDSGLIKQPAKSFVLTTVAPLKRLSEPVPSVKVSKEKISSAFTVMDRVHLFTDGDRARLNALGCPGEIINNIVGGITYAPRESDKYVYIAGPMRGKVQFNFPAFDTARDALLRDGWNVLSPADIDRAAGDTDVCGGQIADQETYIHRDFYALRFIASHKDCGAVHYLKDWEQSRGAAGEFFLARWFDIPAIDRNGYSVERADLLHDFALKHTVVKT